MFVLVVCLMRCVCFVGGFVALIRFRFAWLLGWVGWICFDCDLG